MKKANRKSMQWLCATMLMAMSLSGASCSTGTDGDYDISSMDGGYTASAAGGGEKGGGGTDPTTTPENSLAGIVTAGEWRDLDNWDFWGALMRGQEYSEQSEYWAFYTNNRVAVRVTDTKGNPVVGVHVRLLTGDGSTELWHAQTDNRGEANCWAGLYQKENNNGERLLVSIDGTVMDGHPKVSHWTEDANTPEMNTYTISAAAPQRAVDIAFVVDATGSMGDEIRFLKNDLVDIINKAAAVNPELTIRTAALFYRDENDDYLTRHSDFTTTLSQTAAFVNNQHADGGGDYPEAVHTALEKMLQDLSWNEQARTRLAFMILDAPAHHRDEVIRSLQKSVQTCAALGIRLIPVAASGVDKNTEFMLRMFAIATGGTYVFITNDSGVGNDHIVPTVGTYKVELLNELIIRLIDDYSK